MPRPRTAPATATAAAATDAACLHEVLRVTWFEGQEQVSWSFDCLVKRWAHALPGEADGHQAFVNALMVNMNKERSQVACASWL